MYLQIQLDKDGFLTACPRRLSKKCVPNFDFFARDIFSSCFPFICNIFLILIYFLDFIVTYAIINFTPQLLKYIGLVCACEGLCARACVRACEGLCVRVRVRACACACACVRGLVHTCEGLCARACEGLCVRVRARACACAFVRGIVRARARVCKD